MKTSTLSNNILTIENFLSIKQCLHLINQAECQGFKPADVQTQTGRAMLNQIRNNDRVNWHSGELAKEWWQKLSTVQLPLIETQKAFGLSPHFRFYRYSPGQKFNMHKDGKQTLSGQQTLMTILVYLNQEYIGGATRFRQDDLTINASTGSALIFEHQLWHQGTPIISGTKYILRTDVIFSL